MSLLKYCIFIISYNNYKRSAKSFEREYSNLNIYCHGTYILCVAEAGRAFRVPVFLPVRCRGSRTPLSAHPKGPEGLSSFLGIGLSWGRRLLSARLIREIPYLLDDSLLLMALTGRIEFRSFLCCSIRHDCTDTERWEAGGLWITHEWSIVA